MSPPKMKFLSGKTSRAVEDGKALVFRCAECGGTLVINLQNLARYYNTGELNHTSIHFITPSQVPSVPSSLSSLVRPPSAFLFPQERDPGSWMYQPKNTVIYCGCSPR